MPRLARTLASEDEARGPLHQDALALLTDRDIEDSAWEAHTKWARAFASPGFHRCDRRGARARSARLRPTGPSLEDIEMQRVLRELGDEADIDALGKVRVRLQSGAELHALYANVVERDHVGIAHRDACDVERVAIDFERSVEPGLVCIQR